MKYCIQYMIYSDFRENVLKILMKNWSQKDLIVKEALKKKVFQEDTEEDVHALLDQLIKKRKGKKDRKDKVLKLIFQKKRIFIFKLYNCMLMLLQVHNYYEKHQIGS